MSMPRLPRPRELFCGAAVVALAFLAGCSGEEKKTEPVVSVEVAPVRRIDLERTVTSEAILFPLHEAAITAKVAAPVKQFYVQRGAKVRAGQLLAVLENRDLSGAELESKGAYEQAQANYENATSATLPEEWQKAEFDLNEAKQNSEAQQKIYEARQNLFQQGALPRKELDAAQVAYTQAKNQYELAQKHYAALQAVGKQQQVKSATGQLNQAKGHYLNSAAQLSYTEIRSPIDGYVTDRPLYPGEMASTSAPMITVMDTSQVVARSHIPQEQAALLKIGDPAEITAPGVEEAAEGKVTVVSPALDPNSTTVEVWVQAPNPKRSLRPGSTVTVKMVAAKNPGALVIPASALLTGEDGATTVMLAGSDGKAHQQKVTVGFKQDQDAQITDGLQPGQQVVTKGAYGLPDGTKITVESPAASGGEKPEPGKESDAKKDKEKDKE
jgi:HlyD family secretion protein